MKSRAATTARPTYAPTMRGRNAKFTFDEEGHEDHRADREARRGWPAASLRRRPALQGRRHRLDVADLVLRGALEDVEHRLVIGRFVDLGDHLRVHLGVDEHLAHLL